MRLAAARPSRRIVMTENQYRSQQASDVHDVFDVSHTDPIEPFDVGQTDEGMEQWKSEAGVLAAPPALDGTASSLSVGQPSKPLFGRLPLARVIPQDVHSVMDYLDGVGVMTGALLTSCPKARASSWILGGSAVAASSITDYKLSLAKLVPIEAHEAVDYAFGLSAIAAPFVLGYRKTAPQVAALHVAIGVGVIIASLFTDYRAYRGVGRGAAA
jgi:hypothetical protein